MEKRYVISDIHGNAYPFLKLLDHVDPDPEEMVILGDLSNRGLDTWGVYEECVQLLEEGCDIVQGNHDDYTLRFLNGQLKTHEYHHEYVGGITTTKSFEIAMQKHKEDHVREVIAKVHMGMKKYLETDDYIFVHAGIDPRIPYMNQQKPNVLLLGCQEWKNPNLEHCYDQEIVFGHTPTYMIHKAITEQDARIWSSNKAKKIAVDTGAGFGVRLTLADLKEGVAYAYDFAKREIIDYRFRRAR